jgi:hypothetical protein
MTPPDEKRSFFLSYEGISGYRPILPPIFSVYPLSILMVRTATAGKVVTGMKPFDQFWPIRSIMPG